MYSKTLKPEIMRTMLPKDFPVIPAWGPEPDRVARDTSRPRAGALQERPARVPE